MRWNESVTLEFVKIYLKHECLWNNKHPGYKVKYIRENSYSEICTEFKACTNKVLTVPEVKLKIKNLRTTYVQQVHKIFQKSSPDYIYEPSLIWFNEMDRCLKHIATNRHITSFNNNHVLPEVDSSTQVWGDHQEPSENIEEVDPDPLVHQIDREYDSIKSDEILHKIKKETHADMRPIKKIKRKKLKHRHSTGYTTVERSSDDVTCTSTLEAREDEFDIYGKFIASQLRNMELQKALKLQLEIHNVISQARMSDIGSEY